MTCSMCLSSRFEKAHSNLMSTSDSILGRGHHALSPVVSQLSQTVLALNWLGALSTVQNVVFSLSLIV